MSDQCPPVSRPSEVRRQARVQSVKSPLCVRVPPVRSPSEVRGLPVASPPRRRRPSWDSWIRPSLTDARPSPVRQKSVGKLVCRLSEARCASVSRRAICRRARTPHEPTQDERHTGRDRTQNEQQTNTHAPARQATLSTPQTVKCPCVVRQKPVLARALSVVCPFADRVVSVRSQSEAREQSVICPLLDRVPSVARPWIACCPSVRSPYYVRVLSVKCLWQDRNLSVACSSEARWLCAVILLLTKTDVHSL